MKNKNLASKTESNPQAAARTGGASPSSVQRVVRRFVRIFKCDTARITSPCGTHFLLLGWNERSEGQWHDQDGNPKNLDYVREEVVASGKTMKELIASAKHYKKLLGMKWSDYFREEFGARKEVVKALEAHVL